MTTTTIDTKKLSEDTRFKNWLDQLKQILNKKNYSLVIETKKENITIRVFPNLSKEEIQNRLEKTIKHNKL